MTDLEKCKLILENMKKDGHDVCPGDWADIWSEEEIAYFIINYGESYLTAK